MNPFIYLSIYLSIIEPDNYLIKTITLLAFRCVCYNLCRYLYHFFFTIIIDLTYLFNTHVLLMIKNKINIRCIPIRYIFDIRYLLDIFMILDTFFILFISFRCLILDSSYLQSKYELES